jgi:hypothetical protein
LPLVIELRFGFSVLLFGSNNIATGALVFFALWGYNIVIRVGVVSNGVLGITKLHL